MDLTLLQNWIRFKFWNEISIDTEPQKGIVAKNTFDMRFLQNSGVTARYNALNDSIQTLDYGKKLVDSQ